MNRNSAMLSYIPEWLGGSRFFATLLTAEGKEFDELVANGQGLLKQFYVATAAEPGLDLWEEMLGLPNHTGKPLDQRRSRIIAMLRGMGTVTVPLIQNIAESYVYGKVAVTEHPAQYGFTVKFIDSRGVPPNINDVKEAIEKAKPAHLSVTYAFTLTTWQEVKALNWTQVKTGSWEQLRSREIA